MNPPLMSFRRKEGEEFSDILYGGITCSTFSREEMQKLRIDSHAIAQEPKFWHLILNPWDSMIENHVAGSGHHLVMDLREINYIQAYLNSVGKEIPQEPLCTSYDDVKEMLDYPELSRYAKTQLKYFSAIQTRDHAMITLVKLVRSDISIDHSDVNFHRQNDTLFNKLYHNLNSLMFIETLLFRVKFPLKGEQARCSLILPEVDFERVAIKRHTVGYRGAQWLYAMMAEFYTVGIKRICDDVVARCAICSAHSLP